MDQIKPIYLDYAATTPVDPRVLAEMIHYMTLENGFGNSSSVHFYGAQAENAINKARKQVATLINAQSPREIIWTSGATEANNLAIRGIVEAHSDNKVPSHFITVKTEHKSVLDTFNALEKKGHSVTYLDVEKNGQVNLVCLENALRDNTVLVSVMHVNNEIGVVQPIEKISQIVHQKKCVLHVDAVQSAGKIPIDVEAMQIDLLSLSAHKIYGPKGIGALYVRQKPRVRLMPLITGGGHERGMRAGTLATHQIVGMGTAFEIAHQNTAKESFQIKALRELLFSQLSVLKGIHRNGDKENTAPHILNISIEGVDGEALLLGLSGIAVSSGSACNAHNINASHVLVSLGISQELAHSTLRLSLGRFSTEQEVLTAAKIISDHVRHLRELSPYWEHENAN